VNRTVFPASVFKSSGCSWRLNIWHGNEDGHAGVVVRGVAAARARRAGGVRRAGAGHARVQPGAAGRGDRRRRALHPGRAAPAGRRDAPLDPHGQRAAGAGAGRRPRHRRRRLHRAGQRPLFCQPLARGKFNTRLHDKKSQKCRS